MLPENPEYSFILDLLESNPRGMSLKQISDAVGMNRITVARYLDVLRASGRVEMEPYGQAKVYYLSHRIPMSSLLDFTSEQIIIIGRNKKIVSANVPFLSLAGLSEENIIGEKIDDLFRIKGDASGFQEKISEAFSGVKVSGEICVIKDKQEISLKIKMLPTVFYDGQPGLAIMFEDITERKKKEEAMRLQKDLGWRLSASQTFGEALPLAVRTAMHVLEADAAGVYLVNSSTGSLELFFSEGVSDNFLERYRSIGKSAPLHKKILEGKPYYINTEDFGVLGNTNRDFLKKEEFLSVAIIPVKYKDSLLASFHMAFKKEKEFDGWMRREAEFTASLAGNVITRINAADELKNSEIRYKTLFNHANDMILLNSLDGMEDEGRITGANDMACRKFGYSSDEFQNVTLYDLDNTLKHDSVARKINSLIENKKIISQRAVLNSRGEKIPVLITSHLIPKDSSPEVMSIIKDLRDKRQQDDIL